MKTLFAIAAIATISIAGCTTVPVQDAKSAHSDRLDLYGTGQQVTRLSKVDLQPLAAKGFAKFKASKAGYYGAFAYSYGEAGLAYGAATGHNTLKTAREYALDNCTATLEGGPACKIIAILTPKGFVNKNKMTLSQNVTNDLNRLRSTAKYNAIASNNAGYTEWVNGHATQKAADKEALRLCTLLVETRTPRYQKTYPCYLIPR